MSVAESEAAVMKQAQWGWVLDLVAQRLMGAGAREQGVDSEGEARWWQAWGVPEFGGEGRESRHVAGEQ